jgi:hypothetical protein
MIRQGAAEGRPAYPELPKILNGPGLSLMVDILGDIPYSESGDPSSTNFLILMMMLSSMLIFSLD